MGTAILPAAPVADGVVPRIDFSRPMIFSAFGRKGSGKSTFNRWMYRLFPGDKLDIDVNRDSDPGPGARVLQSLPQQWPDRPVTVVADRPTPRFQNLVWYADPSSATYEDDLDRAVGLALFPQDHRCLVWCGEANEFMPNALKIRPHMRLLLKQNRHFNVTALFDCPRPMAIAPDVLSQSDYVAVFDLPNPNDRDRVADSIGYPPARFAAECDETFRRGPHWFLLWQTGTHQLFRVPPLPVL